MSRIKKNYDYHCKRCGHGMDIVTDGSYAGVYICTECGELFYNESKEYFHIEKWGKDIGELKDKYFAYKD